MADSSKPMSKQDGNQVLQYAFNDKDKTIAVSGFLGTKVGHRVVRNVISSVIDDYEFYDGANLLYTIRVTYNNSSHDEIDAVERIA